MGWIGSLPEGEDIVNLFMTYDTLGELQSEETGIFGFMKTLPRFAAEKGITFSAAFRALYDHSYGDCSRTCGCGGSFN